MVGQQRNGTDPDDRVAAAQLIEDEAWAQFEGSDTALYECMMEALDGDPSQVRLMASFCTLKILDNRDFSAIERCWLMHLMQRIVLHDEVATAVAMKQGRGAPKKGARKMYIAGLVLNEIIERKAKSVDEAWSNVAHAEHVSFDTVKTYWAERKIEVCCSRKKELGLGADEDVDAAIKRHLKLSGGR